MTTLTAINGNLLLQLFSSVPAATSDFSLTHPVEPLFSPVPANPRGLAREDVLVVKGHDHIENVLRRYDIPHLPPLRCNDQVPIDGRLLNGAKYLFANCGGALAKGDPKKIAEWVERGGRLMTTDRMVYHLLEPAFLDEKGRPLVRYHERNLSTDRAQDFLVSEAEWTDPTAKVLLRDGERIFWKAKKASYPVRVGDSDRVRVLARSSALGDLFYGADVLFLRFPYGSGTVVHLMSHWDYQEFDDDELRDSQPPSPRSMTIIREKI